MHRSYYDIGIFLFVCAPVLETQKAREEELAKMMKDIESRLSELKNSSDESEKELKALKAAIEKSQKSRERLEADRKRLATGVR